jgi:flagellar biosynthesis/type III secretory pathway protein FliH
MAVSVNNRGEGFSVEDSEDLVDFLNAAKSKIFDEVKPLVNNTMPFEKVNSFFDLVKNSQKSTSIRVEDVDERSLNEIDSEIFEEKNIDYEVSDIHTSKSANEFDEKLHRINEIEPNSSQENNKISVASEAEAEAGSVSEFEVEHFTKKAIKQEEPNRAIEDNLSEQQLVEEYQRGYSDAVKETRAEIDREKEKISQFFETLFNAHDDLSKLLEELLFDKIREVSIDFLGKEIDEFPEHLLEKINVTLKATEAFIGSVSLQLNQQDAELLPVKKFANGNSINVEVDHELERGEFRIISGRSSFLQSLNDS